MLEAKEVVKSFDGFRALDSATLTVPKGTVYGLVGPNGAGKTTFFNCVTGIYKPTGGTMYLTTRDGNQHLLNGMKTHAITALGMARTFQNIRLFSEMTVLENVMIGRHCRTHAGILSALLRDPRTVREEQDTIDKSYDLLKTVGLETFWNETAHNLPYGATLFMADGSEVKKGDLICEWDPYNAVIISEYEGKASYESVIEGITYRDERDEQTGLSEKVVIESKDKTKNPVIKIVDREGLEVKQYNLPVGAHVVVKDNARIKAGDILIKIPRAVGKSGGDITGGLPRVTELFEARNPSNPAIVSEIDGEVAFGKIKRGNREIIITSKQGDVKRYLVPLSRQIIVQENDYVKAGSPLSDGAITPSDILNILGPTKVQEYIVNEVQEVYRMQGVKINDKHFEVIVRQMMNKVKIEDPGDTRFFEDQVVDKWEFMDVNDELYDKVVVTDAGDSTSLQPGQIVSLRKLRDENSSLKRRDQQPVQVRDIVPATSTQVLQGITRAALQTSSFISAASFQETTKVLNEAAIQAKVDPLENLKENVICGHLIPGGTGLRDYDDLVVGSKADLESLQQAQ